MSVRFVPIRAKGTRSITAAIAHIDIFPTLAEIAGARFSQQVKNQVEGRDKGPLREAIVHHSINGSFAIRQKNWKLELCPDSGGWSAPRPGSKAADELPPVQLYDLANDIGEQKNVQALHPQVVERLTKLLEEYVADGS